MTAGIENIKSPLYVVTADVVSGVICGIGNLVGKGFRCGTNQPVRLLGNSVRAQRSSMKNVICNVSDADSMRQRTNVGGCPLASFP